MKVNLKQCCIHEEVTEWSSPFVQWQKEHPHFSLNVWKNYCSIHIHVNSIILSRYDQLEILWFVANQITQHWWNIALLEMIFKVRLPLQKICIQQTTWLGQTLHDQRSCQRQCSTSRWIHLPGSTGGLQEEGCPWPWSPTDRLTYPSETPASKGERWNGSVWQE